MTQAWVIFLSIPFLLNSLGAAAEFSPSEKARFLDSVRYTEERLWAIATAKKARSQDPEIHDALLHILMDGVRNADRSVIWSVSDALEAIDPQGSLLYDALTRLLRDRDEQVRYRALYHLKIAQPENPKVHRLFIEALKDESEWVSKSAASDLRYWNLSLSPENQRLLVEMLRNKRPAAEGSWSAAGYVLETHPPQDQAARMELVERLRDQEFGVPTLAVRLLRLIRPWDPKMRLAVLDMLKDASAQTRSSVARVLGETFKQDPEVDRALAEMLNDESKQVRESAAYALAEIGPQDLEIQRALGKVVSRGDFWTKRYALTALKGLLYMVGASFDFSAALEDVLANNRLTPESEKVLRGGLSSGEASVRLRAALVLVHYGRALDQNLDLTDFDGLHSEGQRLASIFEWTGAVSEVERQLLIPAIQQLRNPEAAIRRRAANAILEWRPRLAPGLKILRAELKTLRANDPFVKERIEAVLEGAKQLAAHSRPNLWSRCMQLLKKPH